MVIMLSSFINAFLIEAAIFRPMPGNSFINIYSRYEVIFKNRPAGRQKSPADLILLEAVLDDAVIARIG